MGKSRDANPVTTIVEQEPKIGVEYLVGKETVLASGNIRRMGSWVGESDKDLATWLWCRPSQEKWYCKSFEAIKL